MKRYVRATNYYDEKITTEEVAETLRRRHELSGTYTTKRGKQYFYTISSSGWVEVWYEYLHYDGPNRNHMKAKYLNTAPREMQNYLTEKYGEQLGELGITLRF